MSRDISNLKNKAAYLIGLIKTQKKKVPGLVSIEGESAVDLDSSIPDVSQLNITYGKHYVGKSLGPNVNEDAIKVRAPMH